MRFWAGMSQEKSDPIFEKGHPRDVDDNLYFETVRKLL